MSGKNRTFVFWAAGIVVALLAGAGIWWGVSGGTPEKLPCQKEVTCFEKWKGSSDLRAKAGANLEAGRYRVTGRQKYARYMSSDLNGTLDAEAIEGLFVQAVGTPPVSGETPLQIRYTLIENDRLDPNKKSGSCRLFAGYILVSFRQDDTEIYRIQIDYMNPKAKDLGERIACVLASFRNGL